MNKNLIITALLVAVACQSVSAVAPKVEVPASMMSSTYTAVSSFIGNHKYACATLCVSALLVGGYKYLSKKIAQYKTRVEPELDQLVAEVKQLVAVQDRYLTVERIKAANGSDNLLPTIKNGKYVSLDILYPKLTELANTYMISMNNLLSPNMTNEQKVIAQDRAFEAAHKFNHYALYGVLYKVSARSEKDGWTVNKFGIKTLKIGSDVYKAKLYRLSSVK